MIMIFMPFVVILLAAAIFDLLTWTIPNWLCGLLAVSFLPAALIAHMPFVVFSAQLACSLVTLAATFMLFIPGLLGGGDAKLAAAIALWLGWGGLPAFLLQTALWGGALAALLLLMRALSLPLTIVNQRFIARLVDPAAGAPYGAALALGAILALPDCALWRLAGAA